MKWLRPSGRRGRLPHPDVLTPAEWRVLMHLRAGKSNAQIADEVGVTVNTVRYHVSNMLTKLELRHRHELAAWRGQPATATSSTPRASLLSVPFIWLRESSIASFVVKAALVGGTAALSFAVIAALQTVGEPVGGASEATRTLVPGTTEQARSELEDLLASLDARPRPTVPNQERALSDAPAPAFPPHDGVSLVLYDTSTGDVVDLGSGHHGHFSPDSRSMAWISQESDGSELRVIDLNSRAVRSLGPAVGIPSPDGFGSGFVDAHTIEVQEADSFDRVFVDIETGDRRPADFLRRQAKAQGDFVLEDVGMDGDHTLYQLRDRRADLVLAEFPAALAVFGAPGELLIATPWTGELHYGPLTENLRSTPGTVNVYAVDIADVQATFITTVAIDQFPTLPLAGSEDVIAWTETYCPYRAPDGSGDPQGVTWYLDRQTGELVQLDRALWVSVTPDGRIGDGEFGPYGLIDRQTLDYDVVLPASWSDDVTWSPDYRFASQGETGGRGRRCPP